MSVTRDDSEDRYTPSRQLRDRLQGCTVVEELGRSIRTKARPKLAL